MPALDADDRERDRDERGSKQKGQAAATSKSSASLSHVPCKFYRVGSCTAGSSCPFSHNAQEPGTQKEACAWFVKGNCKFGHKCALAHVLPGQSISMDRKNKKAAQAAAAANSGAKENSAKGGGTRGGRRDGPASRNPLLSGNNSSSRGQRPPISMPLKASISPPAVKESDFTSFGALDDSSKLPSAPAHGKLPSQTLEDASIHQTPSQPVTLPTPSSNTLPVSTPRESQSPRNPPVDFGPIGSPPRSASIATSPHRGPPQTSSGTSPSRNANGTGFLSSSPFSAPNHSLFPQNAGRPIASSLSSGLTMSAALNRPDLESSSTRLNGRARGPGEHDIGFDYDDFDATSKSVDTRRRREPTEDDLEDFLPSSLTELLTPEERSRRMSRSNSGQSSGTVGVALAADLASGLAVPGSTDNNGNGHRYSRSVPAPSLLADIGSIWTEQPAAGSPKTQGFIVRGISGSPSRGTAGLAGSYNAPSAFTSGSFDPLNEDVETYTMLSPTNASAAFLPGLHHHYSKARQASGAIATNPRGLRNASNPLYTNPQAPGLTSTASHRASGGTGLANALQAAPRTAAIDQNQLASNAAVADGHLGLQGGLEDPHIMSPGSRALHAHAPGQSLPQGLAAGYSRIHALPPLVSPSSTGGFSVSPGVNNLFAPGPYGVNTNEWSAQTAITQNHHHGSPQNSYIPTNAPTTTSNNAGASLETMFSKLSYSAAASRNPSNLVSPPGIQRNVSGGGRWGQSTGQGPLSPLSGPVVTGDDDDLFAMDG